MPSPRPPLRLKSSYGSEIPPYAALEVTDFDPDTNIHTVTRPTADNLPPLQCVFNGATPIPANGYGYGSVTPPVWAQYSGDEPDFGDTAGTQTDDFALAKDNTGWTVGAVDSAEGLCQVCPFNPGAGITVIESAAFPASSSPHFTLSGSGASDTAHSSWWSLDTPFTMGSITIDYKHVLLPHILLEDLVASAGEWDRFSLHVEFSNVDESYTRTFVVAAVQTGISNRVSYTRYRKVPNNYDHVYISTGYGVTSWEVSKFRYSLWVQGTASLAWSVDCDAENIDTFFPWHIGLLPGNTLSIN